MPLPDVALLATTANKELNQQRKKGEFCDVTFQVNEDQFPAHRIVLANRSPYFSAMFTSGMKDALKDGVVPFRETNARSFTIFLDCIYETKFPEGELSLERLVELNRLACLAQTPFLSKWCAKEIAKKITPETFYSVALHACQVSDLLLQDFCSYYFDQNMSTINEQQVDLSLLPASNVADYLDVSLKLAMGPFTKECVTTLQAIMEKTKDGFQDICRIGQKFGDTETTVKLKEICRAYVKKHEKEFAKPDMKEAKELYKNFMAGLF